MVRTQDFRNNFHIALDQMRGDVAQLGATVVELIPRVTDILLDSDLDAAEVVLMGDGVIDEKAQDLEEQALRALALQAPVAEDLRQVASVLKLAPEIERSADLCVNICKAARRIYGFELDAKLRGLIQRLGDQATAEYKEVVEAYIANDPVRAAGLREMDNELDEIHRQFITQIFESHATQAIDLPVAVQLAIVGRFYERLGDHAVNISHRVLYIATGRLAEYEAEQPDADPTEPVGELS